MRNPLIAEEWMELTETVSLSDCKNNKEDSDDIHADAPPFASHSEAFIALSISL